MNWTIFKEKLRATWRLWSSNHVLVCTANFGPSNNPQDQYQIDNTCGILHTEPGRTHEMFVASAIHTLNQYLNNNEEVAK